jgi:hypothetical protein
VAKRRAVAEQQAAAKAQLRQQAEARLATAVRQKLEIEQALAASIAQRGQLESDTSELSGKRAADAVELRHMRKSRYGEAIARLMRPAALVVAAFALGIAVSAVPRNSLPPEKSSVQAAAQRGAGIRTMTMDDDLSAYPAGVPAKPRAHRRQGNTIRP